MTEKRDVMPGSEKPWIETAEPLNVKIVPMPPEMVEQHFLARFRMLKERPGKRATQTSGGVVK